MNSKTRLSLDLIKEEIEEIIKSSDDYIVELGLYLNKILNSNQIIDFRVNLKDVDIKSIIREHRINHLLDNNEDTYSKFSEKIYCTNELNNDPFSNVEKINIFLHFPNYPEIISLDINKVINNSII